VKKMLVILLVVLIGSLVVFYEKRTVPLPQDTGPFPGKIAIVTNAPGQSLEEYYSGKNLILKYGADKIVHYTWPVNFMNEHLQMVNTMAEIAADRDIKAVVINQAVFGTTRAVDKLRETRKDMFVVYCEPADNFQDIAVRADLVLAPNYFVEGRSIVHQARKQGAKTFVHYSFPRHMAMLALASRRDIIRKTCEELGIEYVDAHAPDPTSNVGLEGTRRFILDDVPLMIEKYGSDTAFFATNCGMQLPLITAVTNHRGIYPQPCCASPFHAFPEAFGIEISEEFDNLSYVISETRRIAAERGMTGRLSNWPVPTAIMFTVAGTEYAIRWINGEAPDESIDKELLIRLCEDYLKEIAGSDIKLEFAVYEENDVVYNNILMLMMGYLVY